MTEDRLVYKVSKFGGSSLASAAHIRRCADLVRSRDYTHVVVSAIGKTTRRLVEILEAVRIGQKRDVREKMAFLAAQHRTIAMELTQKAALLSQVEAMLTEAQDLVMHLEDDVTPEISDTFLSYGERLSSALFRCAMPEMPYYDARRLLMTDDSFGEARPLAVRLSTESSFLTEGFIGATLDGRTTTLGFEGSDFTAALLGHALHANRVDIWTDVRGVFAVDPHLVPTAHWYPTLSYDQMALIASLGGRVLHEKTLEPLKTLGIPLVVRSSLRPDLEGTLIQSIPNPAFWAITLSQGLIHVVNRTAERVEAVLHSHGCGKKIDVCEKRGQSVISFESPTMDKEAFVESFYQSLRDES